MARRPFFFCICDFNAENCTCTAANSIKKKLYAQNVPLVGHTEKNIRLTMRFIPFIHLHNTRFFF